MSHIISIDYGVLFNELCHDLQIPSRTVDYCNRRLKHEGIKFLTVTLPMLGNGITQAVELGSLLKVKHKLTHFRWKGSALHHFDELTSDIFEKDGKPKVDIAFALWRIRQFSLYFYKLSLDFDEKDLSTAETSFKYVDSTVGSFDESFAEKMRKNLESSYVFPQIHEVFSQCRPRFGPGTFSTSSKGSNPYWAEKSTDACINGFVSRFQGFEGFFKSIPSYRGILNKRDSDTSDYSEVCFVPKDSRGPRVITREPLFQLKGQLSFFDYFSRYFERATNKRINFTDQLVNRELAQVGSIKGQFATLDLKEASDRVPYRLVKHLSRFIPVLSYFTKLRSTKAKLPSGEFVNLNKLAGMGSGLTFIWLALICHTAIATEISTRSGIPFTQASKEVYVYGDDVIVSSCHVEYAFNALKKVGLVVNKEKSFFRKTLGSYKCFRESCGGDYYGGVEVGIQRIKLTGCNPIVSRLEKRLTFGSNKAQVITVLNAHAAEMSLNGHRSVAKYLYKQIAASCGRLPKAGRPSSIISEVTREFISYTPSGTGLYSVVKATCSRPEIVISPGISELWHYSQSLRPKVESSDIHDSIRISPQQNEMTVPRSYQLKTVKVSEYSLLARD